MPSKQRNPNIGQKLCMDLIYIYLFSSYLKAKGYAIPKNAALYWTVINRKTSLDFAEKLYNRTA